MQSKSIKRCAFSQTSQMGFLNVVISWEGTEGPWRWPLIQWWTSTIFLKACCLVFLYAAVLPYALAAGLYRDGGAFISTGERNCRVDIPNPVPSVNPVPGADFIKYSCQTSCSLVFRETILSNFDNFEGLQLDRFLLTEWITVSYTHLTLPTSDLV